MIDPLLSLSFNLHAHRGTYALLLGSGVSRSASIPTGWEVTLDLVAKLAHLQGEDCGNNPAGWYLATFGQEPDYSEVLSAIASTSAAQQQLLKGYFEPSEDERAEGKKLPTDAHKAIAKLVRSGHVRVIITTNFDRLMESALEAEGIAPVVVSSPDSAKGAPPLVHSACTVIKVHGDYLDSRIKNSPEALSKYDRGMNKLLDQVFDEYGVVICGWSGEYDTALRIALNRSKVRRYPMYWAGRSEPVGRAKDLVGLHGAQFLKIEEADSFFLTLLEKTIALAEFNRPHPLSIEEAVSTLKRYLSEDRYRIQLRDFLIAEASSAVSALDSELNEYKGIHLTYQTVWSLIQKMEAIFERLLYVFANGAYYGKPEHANAFFDAFRLIAGRARLPEGLNTLSDFRQYPALLIAYSTGVSAVASSNYHILTKIASDPSFRRLEHEDLTPAPAKIYTHSTIDRDLAQKAIPDMENRYTPVSDHISDVLKPTAKGLIPDSLEFEYAFDSFEFLWCLLHLDAQMQLGRERDWVPVGTFGWRRWQRQDRWIRNDAFEAIEQKNTDWAPIQAGLFGGQLKRLSSAFHGAIPVLNQICGRWY